MPSLKPSFVPSLRSYDHRSHFPQGSYSHLPEPLVPTFSRLFEKAGTRDSGRLPCHNVSPQLHIPLSQADTLSCPGLKAKGTNYTEPKKKNSRITKHQASPCMKSMENVMESHSQAPGSPLHEVRTPSYPVPPPTLFLQQTTRGLGMRKPPCNSPTIILYTVQHSHSSFSANTQIDSVSLVHLSSLDTPESHSASWPYHCEFFHHSVRA